MLHLNTLLNKTSSRGQIAIKQVREGVLVLPAHEYRVILETSSVNFELKSDQEQDVLIDTFKDFLNSLSCRLQILIRVRQLDIDQYIEHIKQSKESEVIEIYRDQIDNYCDFIKDMVKGNKILSRRFYIIVPFYDRERSDFETIQEQIHITQDLVVRGLNKLGMRAKPLTSLEVLDLFYRFYNPNQTKTQELNENTVRDLFSNFHV